MPRLGYLLTAMVTPFDSDLKVDYDRLAALSCRLVDEGSDGLVVGGTTGESPTLSKDEKLQMCRVVREAVGSDVIVAAGTGGNDTAASIELTRAATELGILDAVMLVGPYYNKPPQEGFYQHFKACAAATDLPVILYNVPGRTGKNIEAATVLRLAHEVPNIVAVKEASGDLVQVSRICAGAPDGFDVYSGADEFTLPMLAVGSVGVISVVSHLVGPDMARMLQAFHTKDTETAWRLHHRLLDMFEACFLPSGNPACVKYGLEVLGFPVGGCRLPIVPPSEKDSARIKQVCEDLGLL
ncbi:MAG: 4-hydroxy-tetrahydrodipicolinate synthase [Armatimonadia bacterium]